MKTKVTKLGASTKNGFSHSTDKTKRLNRISTNYLLAYRSCGENKNFH